MAFKTSNNFSVRGIFSLFLFIICLKKYTMKENYELMECIYKDLKNKNNKIKKLLEDILKEYKKREKKSAKYLKNGIMTKMMDNMGIKKEVIINNSDSSIAKMLIKGVSTESVDMEMRIKAYDKV